MANKLYNLSEITTPGRYLAIAKSGKTYHACYNAELGCMFFAIPDYEKIIGYVPLV